MPVETAPRKEHLLARSTVVVAARQKLADRLTAFRFKHDLSRRVMGDLVGCSQWNIRCIEEQSSDPSFSVLHALNAILSLNSKGVKKLIKQKGIVP